MLNLLTIFLHSDLLLIQLALVTNLYVAKYLTNLLNSLTTNEFAIKDTFDVVSHINKVPKKLFDDGFRFVSFDVKSLFTNIPLTKTIQ